MMGSIAINLNLLNTLKRYPTNPLAKILLSKDPDEISVWILFGDYAASQKYVDANFESRMDKVLHASAFTGHVIVTLARWELIQMAEGGFVAGVSLY
ncbi:MAG: hypothetical protein FWH51_05045 [Dehalococcoidia bacterium]|nr:hypothetical protein [Dehalococcoidia bacterium]